MGERVLGQNQVLRRVQSGPVQSSRWMKRPAGHIHRRSLSCYLGHEAARWSRRARLQQQTEQPPAEVSGGEHGLGRCRVGRFEEDRWGRAGIMGEPLRRLDRPLSAGVVGASGWNCWSGRRQRWLWPLAWLVADFFLSLSLSHFGVFTFLLLLQITLIILSSLE